MAPPRINPDREQLRRYKEAGLTQQQIADDWFEKTGRRVTRSSIASAMHRAGLTDEKKRYDDALPWTVSERHTMDYNAVMLRAAARRKRGKLEDDKELNVRLDAWLAKLDRDNAVIFYLPGTGFIEVDKSTVPSEYLDRDYPIITTEAYRLAQAEERVGRARRQVDGAQASLRSLRRQRGHRRTG